MSRLKAIFGNDWQYILEVYRQAASPPGTEQFEDRLLLILLEISVKFGERLSNYLTSGFVEIGCGMAIPSLTLAKLGRPDVLAIDVDSEIIAKAEAIKERVGCELEIRCADVFKNRPKLQKGQMLIAEKPASYKKNTLEVEYNISNWCKIEGYNFAIIRDCSSNTEFSFILFFVFHRFCSNVTYLSSFSYPRRTHHAAYQLLSAGLCSPEFAPCIYFFASCDVAGSPALPHSMLTAITNHREKLMPFRDSARKVF